MNTASSKRTFLLGLIVQNTASTADYNILFVLLTAKLLGHRKRIRR